MDNKYINEILNKKKTKSLYEIALDIGLSESSLYKYINNWFVGEKVIGKIENYFKGEKKYV